MTHTMEELFENVEDFNDPLLMACIIARLEDIQREDDDFIEILMNNQYKMVVTWDQPWYQTSNCITRPLDQSDRDKKDMFRTDSICVEENKKMRKNWKTFRKIFGVPNKPICLARWRNKEKCKSPNTPHEFVRRFVMSFLAQGLERNLYQVYKHFVTNYGAPVKGNYSKYEENVIKVCVYQCPKNAVPYLSAVLSREPRGIYTRISQIINGKPEKKRLKWTLPLATKLLKQLMKYTDETAIENLKCKQFEKSVWVKLEEDFGQRYFYLQKFWHDFLHVQLYVKADVKINRLRRKVFKILRQYPYKVWTDIRWKEVANHFPDAFSYRFLYQICYRLLFRSVNGLLRQPLQQVIDLGIERSKVVKNRRLKTLILNENQELEIIRYTNKLKF